MEASMDSVIYYFSGTGNSLKVAKDLSSKLGSTELIKICSNTADQSCNAGYKKVGIVFPVYYYGLPLMVREFVKNLKLDPSTYVYTVATCGGSVGCAVKQLKDILSNNGVPMSSAFTVVMPDNYQVMYSPPSTEKQNKLFKLETEKIAYMAEFIKKSEATPFEEKNSIFAKVLGGMLSRNFKPQNKDKNFWANSSCNGCGICSKVCPASNISMKEDKPQWLHQCEHCLACMQWCPKQALQYKKGTIGRERYRHPEIKCNDLINNV
jgi:ferredoxin/flavodoxin